MKLEAATRNFLPHVEFVIDLLNLLLSLAHEFSCEFWEIFQKTFLYRTPLVAAPEVWRRDFQKPKFWNHVHFWMEKKLKENYKFHGCDWKWLKRGILLGVLLHLDKKFLMRYIWNYNVKDGFQHADFSASADFVVCAIMQCDKQ